MFQFWHQQASTCTTKRKAWPPIRMSESWNLSGVCLEICCMFAAGEPTWTKLIMFRMPRIEAMNIWIQTMGKQSTRFGDWKRYWNWEAPVFEEFGVWKLRTHTTPWKTIHFQVYKKKTCEARWSSTLSTIKKHSHHRTLSAVMLPVSSSSKTSKTTRSSFWSKEMTLYRELAETCLTWQGLQMEPPHSHQRKQIIWWIGWLESLKNKPATIGVTRCYK